MKVAWRRSDNPPPSPRNPRTEETMASETWPGTWLPRIGGSGAGHRA